MATATPDPASAANAPTTPTPQARRALVVIDVQNEYVTGGLPIEYPEAAASLRNIGHAMDAAREHHIPVVVVQNSAPAGAPLFRKGSDGWQLHPTVAQRPYDHYVEKTLPDAFAETDLDRWLTAQGVNALTVIGYMTHNCVDATIKHALNHGYQVEFLRDASGSVSYANDAGGKTAREIHEAYAVVLQSRFAAVATTARWLQALERGEILQHQTIAESRRRAQAAAQPH